MKFKFFIVVVMLCIYGTHGQEEYNYANELSKMASAPSTPESQAFAKYGNNSVNFFTGTPNVEVPLYVHQGVEMNLPISLAYDGSGIKVNQLPTTTGLGWNLNVGGRISRMVMGAPDSYTAAFPPYESWYNTTVVANKLNTYLDDGTRLERGQTITFSSKPEANNYLKFLYDVHKGEYEIQPDLFSINVMGINETFVLDASKAAVPLKNPRLKITYDVTGGGTLSNSTKTIEKFTVTSDDGAVYEFELMETARTVNDTEDDSMAGKTKDYNTGWFLTKITSPHGKDEYEFIYDNYSSRNTIPFQAISEITNPILSPPQAPEETQGNVISNTDYSGPTYLAARKSIEKIKHNGMIIMDLSFQAGFDGGPDTAVTKIDIFDQASGTYSEKLYKTFDLTYSYFKKNTGIDHTVGANAGYVRLKLDGIDISDTNEVVQQYFFEYYDPFLIPELGSSGQDYLGYYNGAPDNQKMYITSNLYGASGGGSRGHNFNHARKGLLKKIQYPTRGYSIFNYEPAAVTTTESTTSTNWIVKSTLTHGPTTLPIFDATQCNDNGVTPSAGFSTAFEITELDAGNHSYVFSRSGPLASVAEEAYIIKVADDTTVVTWDDVFDANCEELNIEVVWSLPANWDQIPVSERIVSLAPGWYQLVLPVHDATETKTLTIEGPDVIIDSETIEISKAGIRIENIKDYSSENTIAAIKVYDYYGVELTPIEFSYQTVENNIFFDINSGSSGINARETLHRPTNFINSDKPHVGYTRVIETVKDFNNTANNGSTTYNFNVSGSYIFGSGNYARRIGNESGASNNFVLDKREGAQSGTSGPGYKNTSSFNNTQKQLVSRGGYLGANGSHNYYMPVITEVNPQTFELNLIAGTVTLVGGTANFVAPNQEETDSENFKQEIARLVLHPTEMYATTAGNVSATTSEEITSEGTVATTSTYTYTANDLVSTQSVTDSKGDGYSTGYFYPNEITGPGYSYLVTNNMITAPVKVEQKKNGTLLSTQLTEYFSSGNGIGMPEYIKIAKGSDTPEERMHIAAYDLGKNVRKVSQSSGTSTIYLWGYNFRYLIAKIDDANFTEVNNALTVDYGALQNLEGTTLETELNNLRTNLPDKLITTYIYDPSVGITSMTDPSGLTSTYQYDDFNRMERIKDFEGNIVREVEYNTIVTTGGTSNQVDDPYSATNITVSENGGNGNPYFDGSVVGLTGGSGAFTFTWYYSLNEGMSFVEFDEGSTINYQLPFDDDPNGDFCGGDIIIRCRIKDNDTNNTAPTIYVYSNSHNVLCGF